MWVLIITVVILLLIIFITLPPLLHLVDEGVGNPNLFIIQYKVKGEELTITLTYNGDVPLSNVIVYVNGYPVKFGDISKGETKTESIPLSVIGEVSGISLSFNIKGGVTR